jgi:hypothetical protein
MEEGIDEIGIQADDEDNDQIETERAHNPSEKRSIEMQKILLQNQQVAEAAKIQNLAPYSNNELY